MTFLRATTASLVTIFLIGCGNVPVAEKAVQPAAKDDLIYLDYPLPEQEVSSPLVIQGRARGNWFFEGSFPLILADWDGRIIAEGIAQAQSDWMTEDFVEFEGRLEYEKPELYDRGSLILKKDNPSGLPENDDALEITVFLQ